MRGFAAHLATLKVGFLAIESIDAAFRDDQKSVGHDRGAPFLPLVVCGVSSDTIFAELGASHAPSGEWYLNLCCCALERFSEAMAIANHLGNPKTYPTPKFTMVYLKPVLAIALTASLIGCGDRSIPLAIVPHPADAPPVNESVDESVDLAISAAETALTIANLDGWVGAYTFSEVGPSNSGMVMQYGITISHAAVGYEATLNIDGFQTMKRLSAEVRQTGDHQIGLFFAGDRGSNLPPQMRPGDLLLQLERQSETQFNVTWGAITPLVPEHEAGYSPTDFTIAPGNAP